MNNTFFPSWKRRVLLITALVFDTAVLTYKSTVQAFLFCCSLISLGMIEIRQNFHYLWNTDPEQEKVEEKEEDMWNSH